MSIQWFPGHMTKALREMEQEIKNIDVLLYCLDSRAPISCLNPKLSKLAENKKIIYVLNKADLVEKSELNKFSKRFESKNSLAITLNSLTSGAAKKIPQICKDLLKEKLQIKKEKGINYSIKCMVVGVPNCGKSTLLNNLCGKAKAETGNRAGVTRGKQWVVTEDSLTLLDTPGTLWPSFSDDRVARNLAYIGSIRDEVLDLQELAFYFIKDMREEYKENLEERYAIKIDEQDETIDIFDKICLSRKCVLRHNELDYDRCARMIIDDFRKGKLGKIILDKC